MTPNTRQHPSGWSVSLQSVARASRPFFFSAFALLASCANDSKEDASAPAPARKSFSERVTESNGYVQDENGNWKPKVDKRSQFESKGESPYFQGEYAKKEYKAGDYAKKSWWGNKEYDRQSYQGKTDGSRFQKSSRFDGEGARESGSVADVPGTYQTDGYATDAAREADTGRLDKPSDSETDVRRKVYKAPAVIDWQEQRGMSLEQSKGILGR